MQCLDVVEALVTENHGTMPNLTQMEQRAVLDARPALARELEAIGRGAAFADASSDEMCGVIVARWNACRASMTRQSKDDPDEVPF